MDDDLGRVYYEWCIVNRYIIDGVSWMGLKHSYQKRKTIK